MEDLIKGIDYLMTLAVLACAILMLVYAIEGFTFNMFCYMVGEAACAGTIIYNKVAGSRRSK